MKLRGHHADIVRLAVPSIVSNITVPLLGLVDVTMMGHIGDARYIGAIAVGSMIFNVTYWLFGFLRMGTSGLTAQAYGAQTVGQKGDAMAVLPADVLRQSLTVALWAGVALLLLQWPLRLVAFWLMGATPDVELLALPYYNICIWGAPAVLGLYALTGWYVGMQNTRIPMVIAIGQNVLNILASLCFVFLLDMKVEGAALGTVVAQWAGFLAGMCFLGRTAAVGEKTTLRSLLASSYPDKHLSYSRFFRLNRDIFLRTLCLVAVNLYFTSAGARQGAVVLAVNTLLMQLYLLFSYFLDGFAFAGEALAGRYYGAADKESLRGVIGCLFGWGLLMAALFTILYALGANLFPRLLTDDATVIETVGTYYLWALLIPICSMAAFIWDGIYIGLTRTGGMLLACSVATVVFFGVWLLLEGAMGNHALWLALVLYLLTRGILQTALYRHFQSS